MVPTKQELPMIQVRIMRPDGLPMERSLHSIPKGRDGNDEIYVMNIDGSNQVNLTNNAADDRLPSWSPDGSKIAFMSDRDGNFEIYIST